MTIKNLLIAMFFLVGIAIPVQAQIDYDLYAQAEDFMEDGDYHQAKDVYSELLKNNPNNANLNFKIGFCYLQTATQKAKAIPYLQFASEYVSADYNPDNRNETSAPIENNFYLGKAYQVNYRFDDAERVFTVLKQEVSEDDVNFLERINQEISACQTARLLITTPVEMSVSNLGQEINSAFTEHSPVISGDESILIFTSKREGNTGGRRTDDGQYFEDIYISSFNGKKYTQAIPISENINTSGHEASISLSFDGTRLFIYRDDKGNGNIYMSSRIGAEWQVPEKLPDVVNTKYKETHASMSFDQNEIFFTSDRKGGYGGLDIYRIRKLPNGKWSKAQNLGPTINTKYDEEGPYLHPDGTSLFFSSKGHHTMGGFDIFVSFINEDDSWGIPENVGYPINTPDDDIYYMPSVDGRRAYYASYANNSLGYYDVFRIDLSETHRRNQTVIAGLARTEDNVLLEDPLITISDMDDNLVGIYTPDMNTGKFLIILPRGRMFHALFEASNAPDREFDIQVPEYAYDQSGRVVVFDDIIVGNVKNIYANKRSNLVEEMLLEEAEELDELARLDSIRAKEMADAELKNQRIKEEPKREKGLTSEELLVSTELNLNEPASDEGLTTKEEMERKRIDSLKLLGADMQDAVEGVENELVKSEQEKQLAKNKQLLWLALVGIALLLILLIILRRKKR